jgi:hypothetical protein
MSSHILVECRSCGTVELPSSYVSVTEVRDAPEESTYLFICERCGLVQTRPAPSGVLAALATARPAIHWTVVLKSTPDLAVSVNVRTDAPPLTYDDLLDFVLELEKLP